MRSAYDLARRIVAAYFRPSHKPFICHLVGTAGALADWGQSADVVCAGLLHSAYLFGDFGDGLRGADPARRQIVRQCVGPPAEAIVDAYTRCAWPATLDQLDAAIRAGIIDGTLAVIKLADLCDDCSDAGPTFAPRSDWNLDCRSVGTRTARFSARPKLWLAAKPASSLSRPSPVATRRRSARARDAGPLFPRAHCEATHPPSDQAVAMDERSHEKASSVMKICHPADDSPLATDSRVGVVIPVYNRRTILLETLPYVLNQSLPPARLVIVDDGSTDGTPTAVEAWLARRRPAIAWEVIRQRRSTAADARNIGFEQVRDLPLVAFLDSDDHWPADFLTRGAAALEANPHAVAAIADRRFLDSGGELLEEDDCRALVRNPIEWFFQNGAGVASCSLLRTAAVEAAGAWPRRVRGRRRRRPVLPDGARRPLDAYPRRPGRVPRRLGPGPSRRAQPQPPQPRQPPLLGHDVRRHLRLHRQAVSEHPARRAASVARSALVLGRKATVRPGPRR